jgi:hypothetical protein
MKDAVCRKLSHKGLAFKLGGAPGAKEFESGLQNRNFSG